MADLDIRPMQPADLDRALDWAASEGWNPGLGDARCFLAADPGGFLMAWRDGVPAACISVVRYGSGFGFLGFYICAPQFRGQGIGLAVWNAGLARLAGRTIGLDGVVAQQENYRRSGFALAHRNVRYGGRPRPLSGAPDPRLVAIDDRLLPAVLAYDRPLFPGPREGFLRCWLAGERRALAHLEDGEIRGYGVLRRCRTGFKIGPLFADTEGVAEGLFGGLITAVDGAEVFLDPPEPNRAARSLAERHGLAPVFETARMYRGTAPDLPLGRIWGITSFELG